MGLATMTMPVLVETSASSRLLLQQWQGIFDRGHVQGPGLAVTTALTYGYVAWMHAAAGTSWKPFVLAAVLTLGIVPYTLVFMARVNNSLFDAVKQSNSGKEAIEKQHAQKLITLWTAHHAGRSLLPLAGAGTGLLAMLGVVSF